jgi:site-specific recombinase XerC
VFFSWLVEEGDIESNPMIGVKAPKVPEKPIPVVSQRAFDLFRPFAMGHRHEAW